MSRCAKIVLRRTKEETMNRSEIMVPLRQQVFEFARTDVWSQLPGVAQEDCLRLLMQQLKQSLESEQKELENEREDPR
jgi:S-ribosylhomocysteine lyase LuxS involved in autoinducer biosynthesis